MFEILDEVCTPRRGTKYSSYVDLFAREDVVIGAGETKVVPLGVKIDLKSYFSHKFHYSQSNEFLYDIDMAIRKIQQERDRDGVNKGIYNKEVSDLVKERTIKIDNFLKSHYLEVALRSSLAVKGLIIPNGIGIIDLDYQDEIGLIVHNPINYDQIEFIACQEASWDGGDRGVPDDYEYIIKKGDKVCQCCLKEHKGFLMGYESDDVRNGGYGSTGK